jgi:hypothetical protein
MPFPIQRTIDFILDGKMDPTPILANSYRDFHVKGFDYICLYRTPTLTQKLYTFMDDAADSAEVVAPHDHRYDFDTEVLAGTVTNHTYIPDARTGRVMARWNFETPLNGGTGFSFAGYTRLRKFDQWAYGKGERYYMLAEELHTITVKADTVLLLEQYDDRKGVKHTSTFTHGYEPKIDGLYVRFTEEQLMHKLRYLKDRL